MFSIPDENLEQVLGTFGMLKGHAYKLKKHIESLKTGDPGPAKKPRMDDTPTPMPPRPMVNVQPKPGFRPSPSQLLTSPRAPVPPPGMVSPLKPNASLTKDVERLMTKLADIESVREDIVKAKELLLSIDVERFRKSLQQVEFVQKTLKAMEEVSAELNALETPAGQDLEG